MKKIFFCFALGSFIIACNADRKSETSEATASDATSHGAKTDLPYTASYSSDWGSGVSDADEKAVLQSYKDWETGNMQGLAAAMSDTVEVDISSGEHFRTSNADLMKRWSTYRDSLSSVEIEMQSWHKMYAADKKEGYVVTWYKETDTYKNGKVDSAAYHDINQMKDGKIIWYAQYKRPLK